MNETEISNAKDLMEKGWQARENHEFEKAEELLTQAKSIFEREEDWFNVTECLNHLALSYKLQSIKLADKSVQTALASLETAKTNNTKTNLIYRNLMSAYDSAGNFEMALIYCEKCLEDTSKPIIKGDLLSHKATYEMRIGKLNDAQTTIETALKLIEDGWQDEVEPHRSIWKCRSLLAKAIILFNANQIDKAKSAANEALQIAKSNNLKTRIEQAQNIVDLIYNE